MTKTTHVKIETRQTAMVWSPTATDMPAKRDARVQMVVTEYGIRFVEPDSLDRSLMLSGLASFRSCLARVTQTVLVATTHLLSVTSGNSESGGISTAGADKTPSSQDRPHARWSRLRRQPDHDRMRR